MIIKEEKFVLDDIEYTTRDDGVIVRLSNVQGLIVNRGGIVTRLLVDKLDWSIDEHSPDACPWCWEWDSSQWYQFRKNRQDELLYAGVEWNPDDEFWNIDV